MRFGDVSWSQFGDGFTGAPLLRAQQQQQPPVTPSATPDILFHHKVAGTAFCTQGGERTARSETAISSSLLTAPLPPSLPLRSDWGHRQSVLHRFTSPQSETNPNFFTSKRINFSCNYFINPRVCPSINTLLSIRFDFWSKWIFDAQASCLWIKHNLPFNVGLGEPLVIWLVYDDFYIQIALRTDVVCTSVLKKEPIAHWKHNFSPASITNA